MKHEKKNLGEQQTDYDDMDENGGNHICAADVVYDF